MKKFITIIITSTYLASCSIISANYISSSSICRNSVSENAVEVYYDKEEVPFAYKEIGRVFLQNFSYWANRDPAGQIRKIKEEAAEYGADAVIILKEMRKESSFSSYGHADTKTGTASHSSDGNSGDVYQFSGIAIVKAE
jgi:hypothetical protein